MQNKCDKVISVTIQKIKFFIVNRNWWIFKWYLVEIRREMDMQMGGTVGRVRKRPSSRRLGPVWKSENITHITQHASQRLSVSPRPPPMADSAEREHLLWKSQSEGEETGGEVMSRRKREYNSDSQELVVVKFLFFKLNLISVLLIHRQLRLTNLQERFYIRNKAPRRGCTVWVNASEQWHLQ